MKHPLDDFKFCPHCGSSRFTVNDKYSKRCADCGFTFYPNAAAATVAVIFNARNELLCIRRKCDPAKGTLDLPGGFVDSGESLTEGLERELKEEINAELKEYQTKDLKALDAGWNMEELESEEAKNTGRKACKFLFSFANEYPYSGHTVHTADAFFLCEVLSSDTLTPSDDAASIEWIPFNKLDPKQFGLHSIRKGISSLIARSSELTAQSEQDNQL